MDTLFLHLLNMSITASWLVAAVLLVRVIFKKAPKAVMCVLWAIVALRLLCPFSLESALSLVPSAETIPQGILYSPSPTIDSGIPAVDEAINPALSDNLAPNPGDSVNPLQIVTAVAANVWLLGVIVLLVYAVVSYIRVYRKVRVSVLLEPNVRLCDDVDMPFIFGILRPQIYLPSTLSDADRTYVLAHERAHLKRMDHLWKPLGFALLTVYWFNPLLWVAYILLCRDIELACDEKVIRDMDKSATAAYTEALLHCSTKQRCISACPLAFGESGVKARIHNALHYKKPAFRLVLTAIAASVAVCICFLTDPLQKSLGTGSELDGVSLSLQTLDLSEDAPGITVMLHNTSNQTVTYGEMFRLYRLENGQTVDTDLLDNRAFHTIGYPLSPHKRAEKHYSLKHYDLSKDGVYCFESTVLAENDATAYKVWVSFEIRDGAFAEAPKNAEQCTHAWLNATCTASKICILCQTSDGDPLGHDWQEATCFTPKTCRACNITEGSPVPHAFTDATCTAPKTCTACGETVGNALPHDASEATCTENGICSVCSNVIHKALGHDHTSATCTEDGVCTRCGHVGDPAHGHTYSEATCLAPATCTYCGITDGDTARHSYGSGGACIWCGEYLQIIVHVHKPAYNCLGYDCEECGEHVDGFHVYGMYGKCVYCGHIRG